MLAVLPCTFVKIVSMASVKGSTRFVCDDVRVEQFVQNLDSDGSGLDPESLSPATGLNCKRSRVKPGTAG